MLSDNQAKAAIIAAIIGGIFLLVGIVITERGNDRRMSQEITATFAAGAMLTTEAKTATAQVQGEEATATYEVEAMLTNEAQTATAQAKAEKATAKSMGQRSTTQAQADETTAAVEVQTATALAPTFTNTPQPVTPTPAPISASTPFPAATPTLPATVMPTSANAVMPSPTPNCSYIDEQSSTKPHESSLTTGVKISGAAGFAAHTETCNYISFDENCLADHTICEAIVPVTWSTEVPLVRAYLIIWDGANYHVHQCDHQKCEFGMAKGDIEFILILADQNAAKFLDDEDNSQFEFTDLVGEGNITEFARIGAVRR